MGILSGMARRGKTAIGTPGLRQLRQSLHGVHNKGVRLVGCVFWDTRAHSIDHDTVKRTAEPSSQTVSKVGFIKQLLIRALWCMNRWSLTRRSLRVGGCPEHTSVECRAREHHHFPRSSPASTLQQSKLARPARVGSRAMRRPRWVSVDSTRRDQAARLSEACPCGVLLQLW